MPVRCALHEDPLEAFGPDAWHWNSWSHFSMFHQDEADNAPRKSDHLPRDLTGPDGTGQMRLFNTVGDRSGLRQCCEAALYGSFVLSVSQFTRSPSNMGITTMSTS